MRRTQLHFGDIPAEGEEPHRTVKQTNLRTLCKITCLGSSIGSKSQKSTKDQGDISDWRKLKEHSWLKSMHDFKLDLCTTKALLEYWVMYQQDFPYFDGCTVITQENILMCRGSWSIGFIICFFKKNDVYLFLAVLGLWCSVWAFSSCNKQGLHSSCGMLATHCAGFSCCRAWLL